MEVGLKVLFRGVSPADYRYKCTCSNCFSIIEYQASDIIRKTDCYREGITHYLGPCPVCDSPITDSNPKPLNSNKGALYDYR